MPTATKEHPEQDVCERTGHPQKVDGKVQQLAQIAVPALRPSPYQPRKVNTQSLKWDELLASVTAQGVTEPLVVRPNKREENTWEIISGHRRHKAAEIACLQTVQCVIRTCVSDEDAAQLVMDAFLGREDLTVQEQAEAVRKLLKQHKGGARAIAERTGWSEGHVRRLANLGNLSERWQEILRNPRDSMEDFAHWTAAHYALIARLSQATQDGLLVESGFELANSVEPKDVDLLLQDRLLVLKKAPWDLDDAKLVKKAGACSACPKRSGCTPGLFDDLDAPARGDAARGRGTHKDRCLDPDCWDKKRAAHVKRTLKETKKEHPDAVMLQSGSRGKGVLEPFEVEAAKEGDKGAIPAVDANADGKVEIGRAHV